MFGVPHPKWGESPMAVCVTAPGASVTEQEVIDLVAVRLGSYQKPTAVRLTTEPLPVSVTGKVQRKVLRDPYWEGRDSRVGGA